MKNKILKSWPVKSVLILVTVFLTMTTVYAGFGISPPYVSNQNLPRGSRYEQKIILVRGDPTDDLKAELTIDVPEANEWISIDKGEEFTMPKGENQVPIIVRVDVPKRAEYKEYKGKINIKTSPFTSAGGGTVGIALGGQIDVDLIVTDAKIFDFKIDGVAVNDLETSHKWLFWNIPGVIEFKMQVENLGNVLASPTKIVFDIYDSNNEELLEKSEAVEVGAVDPFAIEWITAKIPTSLLPGGYWGRYEIYKTDELVKNGDVHLSIMPYGTLPSDYRMPFAVYSRMQAGDQIQFIGLCVLLLLILGTITFVIIYKLIRRRQNPPTNLPPSINLPPNTNLPINQP